jgi:hypothetical protein
VTVSFLHNFQETDVDFDNLDDKAEAKVAQVLQPYTVAALTIGWTFAILVLMLSFSLVTGGAVIGGLFAVATSVVLVWLVTLLRQARARLIAAGITGP